MKQLPCLWCGDDTEHLLACCRSCSCDKAHFPECGGEYDGYTCMCGHPVEAHFCPLDERFLRAISTIEDYA
jgi:hypothetical protein